LHVCLLQKPFAISFPAFYTMHYNLFFMRLLLQRVRRASVKVDGAVVGQIQRGILAFVGIAHADTTREIEWMCEKMTRLRIFPDENGKMNRSLEEVEGDILLVSQFTLYGDARKGLRPSYSAAARPEVAEALYSQMVERLRSTTRLRVETGVFAAMMEVELVNDGPVTIWLEREAESQ
jgi:D-tyrosyl-tRNA(Tyr) deacylase